MAMIQGRLSIFKVGGVAIGKRLSCRLNRTLSTIRVTNMDSSGNEEYLPNFRDATFDFEHNWDDADAGQEDIEDALENATTLSFLFQPDATAGTHEWTGTGIVTSYSPSGDLDGAHKFSGSIQITGALTRTISHA